MYIHIRMYIHIYVYIYIYMQYKRINVCTCRPNVMHLLNAHVELVPSLGLSAAPSMRITTASGPAV